MQIVIFPHVRFWPILDVLLEAFEINLQQESLLLQFYLGQATIYRKNDWTTGHWLYSKHLGLERESKEIGQNLKKFGSSKKEFQARTEIDRGTPRQRSNESEAVNRSLRTIFKQNPQNRNKK